VRKMKAHDHSLRQRDWKRRAARYSNELAAKELVRAGLQRYLEAAKVSLSAPFQTQRPGRLHALSEALVGSL